MKKLFTLVATSLMMTAAAADEIALPPDSPDALAALNASPRHGEWIDIEGPGLKAPLRTWIVYPERSDKAPVVVLIHGIYGLSDWTRAAADNLAAAGFIALAPDLISGKAPGGDGYESLQSRDDVVALMRGLTDKEKLAEHLELLRCYYNFARPHGALKFGRETRTPAMQAGLVAKRLTLDEDLVQVPRVTETALSTLQPASVLWTELEAPKPDRFVGNRDAALRQQILRVPEAHTESMVEPDRVADDLGRKSVSTVAQRVAFQRPSLPDVAST